MSDIYIKRIVKVFLFALFLFILNACDISIKGADGTVYKSYQDACMAMDFQAAHAFLHKMKNQISSNSLLSKIKNQLDPDYEYEEKKALKIAEDYVFEKESLYLIGIGDSIAKKRLLFLLAEDTHRDKHCSMVIDLVMQENDVDFIKTLANHYTSEADVQSLTKLFEYLKSEKGNKDYIINLFKKLGKEELLFKAGLYYDDIALIKEYSSILELSDEDVINFLASKRNRSLSELILGLLTDEENRIGDRPSLGVTSYYWANDKKDFISKCEYYEYDVRTYNEKCQKVMEYGIKNKNRYLAERAISKMKTNGSHTELKEKNEYYRIKFAIDDKSQKRMAKKILRDASIKGAFK